VRPTLKDIASELGLGVTTVSRALSDAEDIAEKTKERVRATANRLGYRRNSAGVSLRTGKTGTISLVLSPHDELVGYGSSLLRGLSEGLRGSDLHLSVIPDFLGEDPLKSIHRLLNEGRSDGVIFAHTRPQDARAKLLLEREIPFVTHGRTELATPHPFCDFDNQRFAEEAATKLANNGAERIALIAPPASFLYGFHMRLGLERACRSLDLDDVSGADLTVLSSDAEIADWARHTSAEGVICSGERSALAAARGFRAAGRDVPIAAKYTSPILPLTEPHMALCAEDLAVTGKRLAELLRARLAGDDPATLTRVQAPNWTHDF
jgi:LacI family transcriptional regulator